MFNLLRSEEEKKRAQIRAYFTPPQPWGRGEQTWILDALGAKLLSFADIELKRKWGKVQYELSREKHQEALHKRKTRMKEWSISERDISSKPAGAMIDEWLQTEIALTIRRALTEVGIKRYDDLHIRPTFAVGPVPTATTNFDQFDLSVMIKDRKDHRLRYSIYRIVVIILGQDFVSIYRSDYNFLSMRIVGTTFGQWSYADIAGFEVGDLHPTGKYDLLDGQSITSAKLVQISITSGKDIEIMLESPQLLDLFDAVPTPGVVERNIRVIREEWRLRKRQAENR